MSENKNNLIPIAIIIAGLLIAGAVYFKNSDNNQISAPVAKAFDISKLPQLAQDVGLDQTSFIACLDSGRHTAKVEQQIDEAVSLGAGGTPFPIIVTANGRTIPLPGAVPFTDLQPVLDAILANEEVPEGIFVEMPTLVLPNENDHIIGQLNAPITIIEYSDLDCPFCKRFHETMKQITSTYGPDQVAWIFRHMPLTSLHPNAIKQTEATECASELGGPQAFWALLSEIFNAH